MRLVKELLHRWWFLVLVLFPQVIPPYTTKGYEFYDWGLVNAYILTHPIKSIFSEYSLFFQVTPLLLIVLIFIAGRKMSRIFNAYVSICYFIIAFVQSISITDRYGFSVCTANLLSFMILARFWFYESLFPKSQLVIRKPISLQSILLLVSFIPFSCPINPITLLPDFNPLNIFTSGTGLSFCMVTPLFLSILILSFPSVNQTVFVATSFMGVIIGIGNMVLEFIIYPEYWWIGILHIPLFIISSYGLWLSFNDILLQVRHMNNSSLSKL